MDSKDTIYLLRECNAGIKMGVTSIDDVLDKVSNEELKQILIDNKNKHSIIGNETHEYLNSYNDDEKDPHPVAKAMAWMQTKVELSMNESDAKIADLIYNGCDMGIKSLHKYKNQYKNANKESVDLSNRVIELEENLRASLIKFL